MKNKKLSFPTKILILDNILCKIFSVFTGIFLSAYFYKISEDYVFQLALYNVVGWIFATLGAVFLADIIKRKDKIWFYRTGIIIKTIFAFTILTLGQDITNHVISLGILYGLMTATNGFPFNMIESENITNSERIRYLGYGNALTGIVSIIAPLIIGRYITETSYTAAAVPIIVITVLELIVSFFLKSKNRTTEKLNLKSFSKKITKDKTLWKLYVIEFLKGFNRNGVMSLIASLIVIRALSNETAIGDWSSVFAALSTIAMLVFAKYYKKSYQTIAVSIFTLIILVSTILVLISPNFMSIVFYNIAYDVFLFVVDRIANANLFDYSNSGIYKNRYNTEYFTFRELFLNAGRIIGYLALMLLALFGVVSTAINTMFIVVIVSIIIMSGLTIRTKIK
ncbi:MAG: hypothetical protein Q4E70_00300 [Candidatus Saccharibacteria bacterium]|nr:hypothetical protein [Candidatus Saccharibacteria bacterium]